MLFQIVPGKSSLFHLFSMALFFSFGIRGFYLEWNGILLVPKLREYGRGTGLLQLQVFVLTCSDLFSFPLQTRSVYEQLMGMLKNAPSRHKRLDYVFCFVPLHPAIKEKSASIYLENWNVAAIISVWMIWSMQLYWISFRSWYHYCKFLVSFRAHCPFAVSSAIVHVRFATHRLFIRTVLVYLNRIVLRNF